MSIRLRDAVCLLLAPAFLATAAPLSAQTLKYKANIDMEIDRQSVVTWTSRTEWTALNSAGLQMISRQRVSVSPNQTFELLEAYTQKKDGRRVQIDRSQVATQDGMVGTSTSYNDLKIRQYAFKEVDVGDIVVMTTKIVEKTHYFPGQYALRYAVAPSGVPREATIDFKLTAPKSMNIAHDEQEFSYEEKTSGDRTIRRWSGDFPARTVSERDIASPSSIGPSLSFSTFANYQAIASTYFKAAEPKAKVTPAIRKLADSITAGKTDPREQAEAIFEWMTKNLQYVGVYFGNGRYVPNDAETVLNRRTGDCKDHVTLMSALLAAKGIESEHVLIHALTEYELPKAPLYQAFNHVILYIPTLDLYTDPTAHHSTFGTLTALEHDKPVVRVSRKGATVTRTPAGKSADNVLRYENRITIGEDGLINGETAIESTGEFAQNMRQFIASTETSGVQPRLEAVAKARGITGTYNMTAPASRDHALPYKLTMSWKGDTPVLPVEKGWRPPVGLTPTAVDFVAVFGAFDRQKRIHPIICRPGEMSQITDVALPAGVALVTVPNPVRLEGPLFSFERRWERSDRGFRVHATLVSTTDRRVCEPAIVNEITRQITDATETLNPLLRFARAKPEAKGRIEADAAPKD